MTEDTRMRKVWSNIVLNQPKSKKPLRLTITSHSLKIDTNASRGKDILNIVMNSTTSNINVQPSIDKTYSNNKACDIYYYQGIHKSGEIRCN